jgi:hypothetical protein
MNRHRQLLVVERDKGAKEATVSTTEMTLHEAVGKWSRPEYLFKVSVVAVCVWILIEAPLELSGSIDLTSLLAVLASKVLICLVGAGAIVDLRLTRYVFAFICASSVFAVAPALPLEYVHSVALALVSMVECLGKVACVVAFARVR